MPYGKIDWSTWTKAAMAKTIDTLTARQTELLNRIAELERRQYVAEGIGRQQACDACRTPGDCDGSCQHRPEDTLGGWRATCKSLAGTAAAASVEQCGACSPEDGCDPKAANCERAPVRPLDVVALNDKLAQWDTNGVKIDWSKL